VRSSLIWLVVAAACQRGAQVDGIHCLEHHSVLEPGQGLNPLVEGHFSCFDTHAACESLLTKTHAKTSCRLAEPPPWFCGRVFRDPNPRDPMADVASCYPSRATCAASSAVDCTAAATVFCTTTDGALECYDSESGCTLGRSLVADVLHTTLGPCTRR